MLRLLLTQAIRRGLWGGSRPWLAVGAVAGMLRLLQRRREKEAGEVVYREKLRPGDVLVIANPRDR